MSEEEKLKNFRIELEGLINKYSMENYCDMTDVEMAMTITKLIVNNNFFEKDKKIERLNNFIKEDIISKLCEIENKRIGYGQTEVDKIWLHNLWGLKTYIIDEIDKENI